MILLTEETLIDNLMMMRLLKLLVTPFNKTKAYQLGIIDAKGNNRIPANKLETKEQKDSYTLLISFIFNLKKILNRIPGGDNYLKNGVAALLLVREQPETDQVDTQRLHQIFEMLDNGYIFVEEQLIVEQCLREEAIIGGTLSSTPVPSVSGGVTGASVDDGTPTNATNQVAGYSKPIKKKVMRRQPPTRVEK